MSREAHISKENRKKKRGRSSESQRRNVEAEKYKMAMTEKFSNAIHWVLGGVILHRTRGETACDRVDANELDFTVGRYTRPF